MCIEVWNSFQRCDHRVYQNTFPCDVARQSEHKGDLTLEQTKFLPDKTFRLPPGTLECKVKTATRPLSTRCPACARDARMAKAATATNIATTNTTNTTTTTTTTSSPSVNMDSSTLSGHPASSPSPGGEAIERVRDSLMMLDQLRKTSS